MAFNFAILVLAALVLLVVSAWGLLAYKKKRFCICCNNPADFQPTVKGEDGTEQPQFSALSMAFYDGVGGMLGNSVNPKKVIKKDKADREAEDAENAEEGTSSFSKDPNDGDMIKRY
ncbi:hypothetical protein ACKWTF_014562 [Chironomus riparius]